LEFRPQDFGFVDLAASASQARAGLPRSL